MSSSEHEMANRGVKIGWTSAVDLRGVLLGATV